MKLNLHAYVIAACIAVGVINVVNAQAFNDCAQYGHYAPVEPVANHTKSYSNGKTHVTLVDTGSDRAKLMLQVKSPPFLANGERTCQLISFNDYIGLERVLIEQLDALYDPSVGLMFDIPVITPEVSNKWTRLQFDLNQATGKLNAAFMGYVGVN